MLSIPFLLHNEKYQLINNRFTKVDLSFIFPFYKDVKNALDEMRYEYEITLDYESQYKTDYLKANDYFIYYHSINNLPKYHYVKTRSFIIDTHDVTNDEYTYKYNYIIYKPELRITIYYPQFIIRNSNNKSKVLKDLYVRFNIDINGKIDNLSGTRTTLSKAEKYHGYHHSHLPKNIKNNLNFQNFCLGSGTQILVSKVMFLEAISKNQEIKNYFLLFLHNLDSVVKFESLEGMPYMRFSDVVLPKHQIITKTLFRLINACKYYCHRDIFIQHLEDNHELLLSCFTKINHTLHLIDKETFEDLVFTNFIINKFSSLENSSVRDFLKVTYNNEELDLTDVVDIHDNQLHYFYFNRKKKYLKVDEIKEIDKSLIQYRLSDEFINYSTKIIIHILKEHINERQQEYERTDYGNFTTEVESVSF